MPQAGLDSQLPDARRQALAALRTTAAGPALALPACVEALTDPDAGVRAEALKTIRSLGEERIPALRPVVELRFREDDSDVLSQALGVVTDIGAPAIAALPRLRQLTHHQTPVIRLETLHAISGLGAAVVELSLPELREMLWTDLPN